MRMIAERRTTIMGDPAAAYPTTQWYLVLGMFVILFVGDLLSQLNIVPGIAPDVMLMVVQMGMLFGAVVQSIHYRVPLRLPGLVPLMLLLAVVFVSAIMNEQGVMETIVFVRCMLGQYVVLVVMLGLRFTAEEYKKLNWAIFALCAVQIPAALFRLSTLGSEAYLAGGGTDHKFGSEAASGTMAAAGGSMGTTFPLMVIGFLYAFYLWKGKKVYLLWMAGFMFFSFCVSKRAFPLVLPIYVLWLDVIIRRKSLLSREFALPWVITIFGLFAAMILHPSLNSADTVGGTIDFRHVFNYVKSYSSGVSAQGRSSGRYSTSKRLIVNATEKGVTTVLIGNGPATLIKSGLIDSNFRENLRDWDIDYGVTGAGWIFAQIGLLGLVCFLWFVAHFFRQAIRIHRREQIPYWRAICGGLIGLHLVVLGDTAFYSSAFVTGKLLPALFFLFLAQVLSRKDLYAKKLRGMPPKNVPPVMRPWSG